MTRIVVVGGYGAFGTRIVERLCVDRALELVVAGRSASAAAAAANKVGDACGVTLSSAVLDAVSPDSATLRQLSPQIVVNASGPFQAQNYALARAAIAVGSHYVDLADARAFVTGIGALDAEARTAGVLVTSGASSVPALAAAAIDEMAPDFAAMDTISHGISPANSYDPGLATTASILGGLGRASPVLIDGEWRQRFGWQGLSRHSFPAFGSRLMSHCDVPDHDLFPSRYAGVRTVAFTAGLEVGAFHMALWSLSWACRAGLLKRPERLATALLAIKRRTRWLGSDRGGMFVQVAGRDEAGHAIEREVHVLAASDHGPHIPPTPAILVARKLARGAITERGAMPCLGLFTLAEFEQETTDLDIEVVRDRKRQL